MSNEAISQSSCDLEGLLESSRDYFVKNLNSPAFGPTVSFGRRVFWLVNEQPTKNHASVLFAPFYL
jgi:hypothetical protein